MEINEIVNKIINDDCIKVMTKMPESCTDLIVTDPPYRNEF